MRGLLLALIGLTLPAGAMAEARIEMLRAELADAASPHVMVAAHRACWADGAPENSLAAIRACQRIGVDIIEIDVMLTADGIPVLQHDPTLDRMTDGNGAVSRYTLAQLRKLRLRAGHGGASAKLTRERIPTLAEALAASRGRFLVNLDVKGELYPQAAAVVRELGMEGQIIMKMNAAPDDPALTSAGFIGETLFMPIIHQCAGSGRGCASDLAAALPGYDRYSPAAYEVVFSQPAWVERGATAMRGDQRHRIWVNALNPTLAGGLTDNGAARDPDGHWGRLLAIGAGIVQTDRPAALIAYLQAHNRRSD